MPSSKVTVALHTWLRLASQRIFPRFIFRGTTTASLSGRGFCRVSCRYLSTPQHDYRLIAHSGGIYCVPLNLLKEEQNVDLEPSTWIITGSNHSDLDALVSILQRQRGLVSQMIWPTAIIWMVRNMPVDALHCTTESWHCWSSVFSCLLQFSDSCSRLQEVMVMAITNAAQNGHSSARQKCFLQCLGRAIFLPRLSFLLDSFAPCHPPQ